MNCAVRFLFFGFCGGLSAVWGVPPYERFDFFPFGPGPIGSQNWGDFLKSNCRGGLGGI